jgi:hypothetical protein
MMQGLAAEEGTARPPVCSATETEQHPNFRDVIRFLQSA